MINRQKMRIPIFKCILIAFPVFSCISCSDEEPANFSIQEKSLGKVADISGRVLLSPDGRHIAYEHFTYGNTGHSYSVVVDGVQGKKYSHIRQLAFSPDNRTVYVAEEKDKSFVVVNGVEGKQYDEIGFIVMSDKGSNTHGCRIGYTARSGEIWFAVIDNSERPECSDVGCAIWFSTNGKRTAYTITRGGKTFVVLDSVQQRSYETVVHVYFSSDAKRYAYIAIQDGKYFVVMDGKEGKKYNAIDPKSLSFSADGAHVVYSAYQGEKEFVVVDGKEGKEYDGIWGKSIRFSHDGKHYAYVAEHGCSSLVVVDGVEGRKYDYIGPTSLNVSSNSDIVTFGGRRYENKFSINYFVVVNGIKGEEYDQIFGFGTRYLIDTKKINACGAFISPDGKSWCYAGKRGKYDYLIANGVKIGKYKHIEQIEFSPTGNRLAFSYLNDNNKWQVCIDGIESAQYDELEKLEFSPNGSRNAYAAKEGKKWFVFADGIRGTGYDEIDGSNLAFSPDSRHIAYIVTKNWKHYIVIDSLEIGPYDSSIPWYTESVISFTKPTSLYTIVEKNRELLLVDIDIE